MSYPKYFYYTNLNKLNLFFYETKAYIHAMFMDNEFTLLTFMLYGMLLIILYYAVNMTRLSQMKVIFIENVQMFRRNYKILLVELV